MCTKSCTQNSVIPLFFGGFQQLAHHFNENCLKISIFYSKLKSDHYSSIGIIFKVQNRKLAQFGQFLSDFDDLHLILTRIFTRVWTCFRNKNRTIVAQTATILVHRVIFFGGGGAVFSQPFMCRYINKRISIHSLDKCREFSTIKLFQRTEIKDRALYLDCSKGLR